MEPVYKICKIDEVNITKIASEAGISAEVISVDSIGDGLYRMGTKKYPHVLIDYPFCEWKQFKLQVVNVLNTLHNLGIVHGDLSEENIVIGEDGIAKLIDFGMSFYYKTMDVQLFNKMNDFDAVTVDNLPEYDFIDIQLLFGTV